MKISCVCHCGEIEYEAELDPENVGICHCADCQSLSATAYRTLAIVSGASFRILKGKPKEYIKVAESGNRRVQAFCGNCGSALYATDPGDNPAKYNLRAGTVKQRNELVPRFECWRQSALSWVPGLPDTRKFDRNPG